ncbi:MAG: hypothetical protein KGL69_06045 [Alphaproteobacteria bacterium]|nr:hypothetical protein [Alphaproteobacteria bacterium]
MITPHQITRRSWTRRGWAAALGVLSVLGCGLAQAEPLTLVCHVHASRPDQGHSDWTRRLVIDSPTRTVKIFDDFGSGFTLRATYPLVGMNLRRITLEAGDGKESFVDRRTGQYRLINRAAHFELAGPCEKAEGPR